MRHIFDPKFRYKPSFATDVKKTFEKIRRRQQKTEEPEKKENVVPLGKAKQAHG